MGKSSLEEEGMKDDSQWLVRLHLNPLQVIPSVNAQFLLKVMEQPLKPSASDPICERSVSCKSDGTATETLCK
jgi:hypothetical protein